MDLEVILFLYIMTSSGRQMEKLLIDNIAYMWLSGMQTPDFRTINIFRSKRLAEKFDGIFTQIVLLLHDENLVSLKVQYIDGTKIESVANKYTFVWKGSTEKNKAKLENNVREVLRAAETALAMENAEEHKKYGDNPFLPRNMFYNKDEDYYVCPMGRHMIHIYDTTSKSDLGYVSVISVYRTESCEGCPLRGMCYKGKAPYREIDINHQADEYRAEAKRLLTSERGLYHRSNRPIEPEAVFGDIKQNHGFKRFKLKSNRKVKVEFGLVATAHKLRKYIALEPLRSSAHKKRRGRPFLVGLFQ